MAHVKNENQTGIFGKGIRAQETRLAWLLMSPTALIVFGLVLFPAFFSIWISFHDVGLDNLNNVFGAEFTGFDNYRDVIDDFAFKWQGWNQWGAFVTTIVYSFTSTILTLFLGLIAALILNQKFVGRGLARGIFLFPYVAPVVSVAFVWRWILDPGPAGVLNDVLMSTNVIDLPKAYLAQRGLAIWIVVLFQGWRYFPFAMLMILARLQAIDTTLFEAVDVDGGNAWDKFRYVTLPDLRYVLGAIFLLRLLWTFNKFDDIWLLTGGGYGTNVLPVLTYQFSFNSSNFGKGAATAMILLVFLVVFIVIYVLTVMRNLEED
ncbi:MAG: sugar ABC transporter permease [Anaerolineae bacterium]|nr:sugar ABC transporter permease [Anaerolineae bacterium]MDQ7037262.1 sugar ABC transporter permease [Anaerolineae bacterium]